MLRVVSDSHASPCMNILTNQYMTAALHHCITTTIMDTSLSFPGALASTECPSGLRLFNNQRPLSFVQQPNTPARFRFIVPRSRATLDKHCSPLRPRSATSPYGKKSFPLGVL